MCEILIRIKPYHAMAPAVIERTGKRVGRFVVLVDDGELTGIEELRTGPDAKYGIISIPGIPKTNLQVQKFVVPVMEDATDDPDWHPVTSRIQKPKIARAWELVISEIPNAVKLAIRDQERYVIKAGTYDGPFDKTWEDVRGFFKDVVTDAREAENL